MSPRGAAFAIAAGGARVPPPVDPTGSQRGDRIGRAAPPWPAAAEQALQHLSAP